MTLTSKIFLLYFLLISLITTIVTVLDKIFAKKDMRRVPEKMLFALGFSGGAFAEYVTMKLIRHKTLHKKFMIGLPLIVLLHGIIIFALLYLQQLN